MELKNDELWKKISPKNLPGLRKYDVLNGLATPTFWEKVKWGLFFKNGIIKNEV